MYRLTNGSESREICQGRAKGCWIASDYPNGRLCISTYCISINIISTDGGVLQAKIISLGTTGI